MLLLLLLVVVVDVVVVVAGLKLPFNVLGRLRPRAAAPFEQLISGGFLLISAFHGPLAE